jgi:hypothetical protein
MRDVPIGAEDLHCCRRSAVPKAMIEQWVLEQIGRTVQDYLGMSSVRETALKALWGTDEFPDRRR